MGALAGLVAWPEQGDNEHQRVWNDDPMRRIHQSFDTVSTFIRHLVDTYPGRFRHSIPHVAVLTCTLLCICLNCIVRATFGSI